MPTIVYDTETSGVSTTYDQVFQFAAILADDNMKEVDSFEVRCRRLPHIVPGPSALLVTGLMPEQLENQEKSHFQMVTEIHRRLAEWSRGGARFAGYNSLRFDEPILRQAYYQNLLPIYQTNTGGNTRIDIMRMFQISSALEPGKLAIPKKHTGAATYRLSEVSKANSIELSNAHDALSDTRATLAVARLIRKKTPDTWRMMLDNSDKKSVEKKLARPINSLGRIIFGKPYFSAVTEIARNIFDRSEVGVFNLAFDPTQYLDADVEAWLSILKGPDNPIRTFRINAQPMLFDLDIVPNEFRDDWCDLDLLERRAEIIVKAKRMRAQLSQALVARKKNVPSLPYVESRLYDSFADDHDAKLMRLFHESDWSTRVKILSSLGDKRFRELGGRIVFYEQPDALNIDKQGRMDAFVRRRLMTNEDVPWNTIPKALAEIRDLKEGADGELSSRLSTIARYLRKMANSL